MPTGEELAKESKKRDEEREKKIAEMKAQRAADNLGGISGQGVSSIRKALEKRRKMLENL